MSSNRSVLITGVSTGIGMSIAEKFLSNDYLVFGSIRKKEDGMELSKKYGDRFIPLLFDVTDLPAILSAVNLVEEKLEGDGLDLLVNNAGIAKGGPLLFMDMQTIRYHFEVNVFGVLNVIRAFSKLLGAVENYGKQPGRIINISSVSGKFASPFVGPYSGSKHALEGISGTLRRELMLFGIDVVVVAPGVVKTPIWQKGDEARLYEKTPYRPALERFLQYIRGEIKKGLEAEDIADLVYAIAKKRNPKTRYTIVPNYFKNQLLRKLMPERIIDQFIGKNMGLIKT